MAKWVGWGIGVGLAAIAIGASVGAPREAAKPSSVARPSPVALASEGRLPPELKGVQLELDEPALRKRRPRATRHHGADDETFFAYTEALPRQGGHALYLFSKRSQRLARVQVASSLRGPEAIAVRINDMQGRHGAPDGVWDCPALGEHPPTRRFTWTRGAVGVMDAYLLLGDHVSATFMVASTFDVRRAIERATCQPVSPERFSKFPALPLPPGRQ